MNVNFWNLANTWTALVFGAVFNVLTAGADDRLIEYSIKTVIGGFIWFCFQVLAEHYKTSQKNRAEDEHKKE